MKNSEELYCGVPLNLKTQESRIEMAGCKYSTYGHYNVNEGFATVLGCRVGDKIFYGISMCSPDEKNFSKKEGRRLAIKHLVDNNESHMRGMYKLPDSDVNDSSAIILSRVLHRHLNIMRRLPDWARCPRVDFRRNNR
jgi:hypothetical protein